MLSFLASEHGARVPAFGIGFGTGSAALGHLGSPAMAWSEEERFQLERVFEVLDQTSSEFERLVNAKDRLELVEELGKLKQTELQKILLTRVLLEQLRRAHHYGYVPFTPFQDS